MTLRRGIRLAGLAALVLAAMQFVPVTRSNPPVGLGVHAPPGVRAALERVCWNCHSNETRWPWYAYVAPASWLVVRDVRHARAAINFTSWPVTAWDDAVNRRLVWSQVRQGKMPLRRYAMLHADARLSDEERELIRKWAESADAGDLDPSLMFGQ